jgi:hypothetical protein
VRFHLFLVNDGTYRNTGVIRLTEDAGEPCVAWDFQRLEKATQTLATIQQKTVAHASELLVAGGYDLRIRNLGLHIGDLFAYLAEIMPRQTSHRSPRIDAGRLSEMENIVTDACGCMDNLGISNAVECAYDFKVTKFFCSDIHQQVPLWLRCFGTNRRGLNAESTKKS